MTYHMGVDIGTTFSAAAVASEGRAEVISLGHHAATIPSVLFLREEGTFLFGDAASRRGLSEPGRVAREFKRRFGDTTPYLLGGAPWSADALTAQLLRYVVDAVAGQQGGRPERVAVTYPANWGPYKVDLLRQTVRLADLQDPRLLTEPEAAAIYYASTERVEVGQVVAIYDLGGGTFDAAVLRKRDRGFELLGQPEGIERLGGIDFDQAVVAHVSGFVGPALSELDPDDPAALSAMARLRADCVAAKEALSEDTEVSVPVLLPNLQTEIRLTRAEFEALIRPTLAETVAALSRALRSGGVSADDVKAVLLVGGSSRIPLVGQLVAAELGRPVAVDVHPKHAVALGAALAALGSDGVQAPPVPPPRAAAPVPVPGPLPPPSPVPRAVDAPADARPEGPRRPLVIVGAVVALVAVLLAGALALARGGNGGNGANGGGSGDGGASSELGPPEVPTFDVQTATYSIAAGAGALWLGATDGPTVARFDMATNQVTGTVRLPGSGTTVHVAFGAGAVWAALEEAGTVSRIDPATSVVTATYRVGREPLAVLVAAGAVWVTVSGDGIVMRIDPGAGAMTPVIVRGKPLSIAYGAGSLWVTQEEGTDVLRVDPAKNSVVGLAESGGCAGFIVADDSAVWVQDRCDVAKVFKVDPASGKVVGSASVGQDAKWLALARGSLWVANSADGTVSQVDTTRAATVRTIRVAGGDVALVADGDTIWVANSSNNSVSKISP